uniref:Protein FAM107B n=2 Tax=Lygus hesperus TaxID=30085 RepID=A0A146MAW4_LYGHE
MTEEITLLLPPQDLAARRHFFEEVATGGNRFHRSTPATPLAVHRSTTSASDVASLAVGVVMEKCLSENSLLAAQDRQASAASKSDGAISSNAQDGNDEVTCDSTHTDNNSEEENSCGGEEDSKMTGVTGDQGGQEGLILPKKLQNPCLENTDRQRLHRELMLNQKLGKNVLNQKSELQKAMEQYKDKQFRKELEQQRQENMTPLERVIEQRAKRLEILDRDNTLNEKEMNPKEPEFLQIHAKLRARMDAK